MRWINYLHDYTYWTHYHLPVMDGFRFRLIRSKRANDDFGSHIPRFDRDNPDMQNIFIGGTPTEEFSPDTRVLVKYQHSPGFGLIAFLKGYHEGVRGTQRKYMLPMSAFICMQMTEHLTKPFKKIRDKMANDPLVKVTRYDLALNELYRTPRLHKRIPGSVLVACNWRLSRSKVGIDRYLSVVKYLATKASKVTCQLHPMALAWHQGASNYRYLLDSLEELQKSGTITSFARSVTRPEMIELFDTHEYIASDGSGSLYEAVARGCKAVTISGLPYQRNNGLFHAAIEGGYLAPTDAMNFDQHPGLDKDWEWLKGLHGESLINVPVRQEVQMELEKVFDAW
jgi:hypothetical protein